MPLPLPQPLQRLPPLRSRSSWRSSLPLSVFLCLLVILLFPIVSCSGADLNGVFVYSAEHSLPVQSGAPLTDSDCMGTSDPAPANAASLSFYASGQDITVEADEHGLSVTPSHPSCLGVMNPWQSMSHGMLMRQCNGLFITVAHVEADADEGVDEGITVTVSYGATGGFCSTHLPREESAMAATVSSENTGRAWLYSFIGVGISSVVSLIGVSLLLCQRWRLRSFLLELLGLSCGTFLGSICFSLLPETALEIGLGPKITAVMLAGIVFGIMSETAIHYGAHKIAAAKQAKANHNKGSASPSAVQLVAVRGPVENPLPAHTLPCDTAGCAVAVSACAAAGGPCDTAVTCTEQAADVEPSVVPACGTSSSPAPTADDKPAGSVRLHLDNGETTAAGDSDLPDLEAPAAAPSPQSLIRSHSHSRSSSTRKEKQETHQHHHHHHDEAVDTHAHAHSHGSGSHSHSALMDARQAAIINCLADGIHNFIDGALIGGTFLVSPSTGWTTVLAITLHELPQEMADFSLLTNAGWSNCTALIINLLVSFTGFIGAAIAISVGAQFAFEVLHILPFAVGLFLYLSLSVLVPEMRKATGWQIARVWLAAAVGIGMMASLLATPWGHSHGGESSEGGETDAHAGHNH